MSQFDYTFYAHSRLYQNPSGDLNTRILRRSGCIGTRIFGGRMAMEFNNTSAYTWEVVMALAQEFDAVRVIFANSMNSGGTTASPVMLANVAAVGDPSDSTLDAADWSTGVSVNGAGTWNLTPASAVQRRGITVSDWVPKGSIPRTDGGTLPLLAVRAWVNGGNPLTLLGAAGNSFVNWATKPDGRIWKMRKRAGDYANANQSSFTAGASAANESPIIGVQYAARGKIVTVMGVGDSIYEGRGTYIGEGFIAPAVWSKSNKQGVAWEFCNLSWSGTPTSVFVNALTDIIAAGVVPDVCVFPSGSPNDIATTISEANIAAERLYLSKMLSLCRANSIEPLVCSWMPSNYSVKSYGSTDALRAAYSAEVEARSGRMLVAATSSAISGPPDTAHGNQITMLSGATTDNIHPNDFGSSLLVPLIRGQLDLLAI